jgi:predicted GTPase
MTDRRTNTKPILNGLIKLEQIITQPRSIIVLELDKDPSKEKKKILDRLIDSLDQYSVSRSSLFYIGLMGAYSSGKSSTINSLLRLNGTPLVRIPMKSSTSSGDAVHLSGRSDASISIIQSSGRHGQGRIDLAP